MYDNSLKSCRMPFKSLNVKILYTYVFVRDIDVRVLTVTIFSLNILKFKI